MLCYYWLFIVHLLYYSFVIFLASAFLPRSTTFSFSQSHRSAHKSQLTTPHCQSTILLPPPYHFHHLLVVYSHSLSFRSFFLLFVLLSSDIELNPGPSAFTLCTLNVHSILHPLHSAALSDLIDTHNPDLFCLGETWIKLPPLLNFLTARLHTTPWSALPIMAPSRSHPLPVAQLYLSVNLSHSYPPLFQISHHLNHLLSLCNFLI